LLGTREGRNSAEKECEKEKESFNEKQGFKEKQTMLTPKRGFSRQGGEREGERENTKLHRVGVLHFRSSFSGLLHFINHPQKHK
jgi:hypothetical protein